MAFRVAVVGATGLVGKELVKVLEKRRFPATSLRLLASDRSAGKTLFVNHQEVEVQELTPKSLDGIDLAFFAAGADVSLRYAPVAARKGTLVIDKSDAFRMHPRVPLVVPEVNPYDLKEHRRLIASPNCATIQLVMALNPLQQVNPLKRVVVSTYQSVSGTGATAIQELTAQSKQVLEGKNAIPHVYKHQIAFNLLPEIDVFLDNGYSKEEWKTIQETRKIMHLPELALSATCVRVPVFIGHSEAVHVEFSRPMSPEEARRILSQAPGVKVQDDPSISLYPYPWTVAGTDDVFVGRLRADVSVPYGLAMWVVADNLRKGAALNAVQIAEELIKRDFLKGSGDEPIEE